MKQTFMYLTAMMMASALFFSCATRYAISAPGENLSALTKVTDTEEPCITPFGGDNGKDLFFASRENKTFYNIYKKENAFSNAMSQKTSGKNFNIYPTYNAENEKIAFSCQMEGSINPDIYVMNSNQGQALTQITETMNAYEGHPCFSMDGKFLVYDRTTNEYYRKANLWGSSLLVVQNTEIWLRNLQSGENTLLGNGSQPTFSPNGTSIAYVKYSADAKSCCIWTMNLDGSNQTQVTDPRKGYAFSPRFSPDGSKIVFELLKKEKKDYDIYIIDIDGNNLTQVTINKSYDGQPYWTTDNYIYFVSDRGSKMNDRQIWRFQVQGNLLNK